MNKQYDTLVVTGMGDKVPRTVKDGTVEMEVRAWASGQALDRLAAADKFIEDLSLDLIPSDEIQTKAESVLEELRKP